MYLKKYFGILYNVLTYDKFEYAKPSIKDIPEKLQLTFDEYIKLFEKDFKEHQNTIQPRVALLIILNLQYLLIVIHRLQEIIGKTDVNKLYEQTLAYGNNLTKKELIKIYGILVFMEHFTSITSFHDRFASMKSIPREIKNGTWIGLKIDQELLKNEQLTLEDLRQLSDNELSIQEIINVSKILIQELKSFYDFESLMKKKIVLLLTCFNNNKSFSGK